MLKPGRSRENWDQVVTPAKPKARLYFLSYIVRLEYLQRQKEVGSTTKMKVGGKPGSGDRMSEETPLSL